MGKITVVGLGPGDWEGLPLGTYELLRKGGENWLRTEKHPVVKWMAKEGIPYQSFDYVYERERDFATVYQQIVAKLLAEAGSGKEIVYGVPGHPLVAERTVQLLLEKGPAANVSIDIRGGGSFLDVAFARLQIDPIEGFQLLDGTALDASMINPRLHLLVGQVYDQMVASEVKLTLMEIYPDETPVILASALGIEGVERIRTLPLFELDRVKDIDDLTLVYVAPTENPRVLRRRFDTLTQIVAHLRGPEGCPWDQRQTHHSLRPYLLEEAYEFLEAVAEDDSEEMAEELGDLLLQVLLHAQIGHEEGTFTIEDVIYGLSEKLIRRHPHVFGTEQVTDEAEVRAKWEAIKEEERSGEQKNGSLLEGVENYPALLRAHELQQRASKVGFDWSQKEEVREKVLEELEELFHAEPAKQEAELGDVLFSVVALARFFEVDPEQALLTTCRKFVRRFHYLEERAQKQQQALEALPLEQLDQWWNEAKKIGD